MSGFVWAVGNFTKKIDTNTRKLERVQVLRWTTLTQWEQPSNLKKRTNKCGNVIDCPSNLSEPNRVWVDYWDSDWFLDFGLILRIWTDIHNLDWYSKIWANIWNLDWYLEFILILWIWTNFLNLDWYMNLYWFLTWEVVQINNPIRTLKEGKTIKMINPIHCPCL